MGTGTGLVSILPRFFRGMAGASPHFVGADIRDCLSLRTAAGRRVAHVLASVACYETKVRSERQRAGISVVQKDSQDGTARHRDGTPRTSYGSGRWLGQAVKVNAEVVSTVKA